jgi:hypothetical protein
MKQVLLARLAKKLTRRRVSKPVDPAASGHPKSRTTAPRADLVLDSSELPGTSDPTELRWINAESCGPRAALLVESILIAGRRRPG